MRLNEESSGDTGKDISLRAIGNAVGLDWDQTRIVASHLENKGWVKVNYDFVEGGSLRITPNGIEEVERLFLPAWKRFVTDKVVQIAILSAVIATVISAIIVGLI